MRSSSMLISLSVLAVGANAINLVKPRGSPSVIEFGLKRSHFSSEDLQKRSSADLPVDNLINGFFYVVNISIGTPPQSIQLSLDTGSSDLAVNDPASAFCTDGGCPMGGYDPTTSTSAKTLAHNLDNPYAIGSMVGDWISDTVELVGQSIPNFVVGSGSSDNSNQTQNIFGISYPSVRLGTTSPANDTSLGTMVKAGIIKSASFSIYLNETKDGDGSILFGGVDTSMYLGELKTFAIVPDSEGVYTRLTMNLSSVAIPDESLQTNSSDFPIRVMLDTGNPDIRLPERFIEQVWSTYNVSGLPVGPSVFGLVDCSLQNSSATVDFAFSDLNISLPLKSLIQELTPELLAAYQITTPFPEGICLFLLNPLSSNEVEFPNVYILGDPFLRYVYYVGDMESNQIGLAKPNPTPGASNILEISAGGSGLDSAIHPTTTSSTASSTSSPTSSPSPSTSKAAGHQLKSWSVAGMIGLGSIIGFM